MIPKELICKICNKKYHSIQSLCNHNKKFHSKNKGQIIHTNIPIVIPIVEPKKNDNKKCKHCNKILSSYKNKWRHETQYCKIRNENIVSNSVNLKIPNMTCEKKELFAEIPNIISKPSFAEISKINLEANINYPINNQLINIIVDKSKTIEELKSKIDNNNLLQTSEGIARISDCMQSGITKEYSSLTLNNVIIISRNEDNYINATELCQAGNKHFNDWFQLDTTKQLINEANCETGIDVSLLIDFNQCSWIHPDLAIQLAQWISPKFYFQVSKWIRKIFNTGNVSTNIKLLENHMKEIKLKDHKIQLLEDSFIKKQHKKNYPDTNIIYMLTTEDNKKKRIYIIGKTINLKKRLSSYNKTSEHEVIYYKSCNNKQNMNLVEIMVLNKLNIYKEKANRDRFILPVEKDIVFFIDIINNCINFINI